MSEAQQRWLSELQEAQGSQQRGGQGRQEVMGEAIRDKQISTAPVIFFGCWPTGYQSAANQDV